MLGGSIGSIHRGGASRSQMTNIHESLTIIISKQLEKTHCMLASLLKARCLKPMTHASETGVINSTPILEHVSYRLACIWRQIFTGAGFWSQIETALFLHQKPAGTAFSDWLTDLFGILEFEDGLQI